MLGAKHRLAHQQEFAMNRFRVWEPFSKVSVLGLIGEAIGLFPILNMAFQNRACVEGGDAARNI